LAIGKYPWLFFTAIRKWRSSAWRMLARLQACASLSTRDTIDNDMRSKKPLPGMVLEQLDRADIMAIRDSGAPLLSSAIAIDTELVPISAASMSFPGLYVAQFPLSV
jgi:hypothetical protein